MQERFSRWNEWLARRMFLLVLLALGFGFSVKLPAGPAVKGAVIGLFAYMTFVTSIGISFRQFFRVLSRPWVPLWVLVLVHVVTPLVAWGAGQLFYPDDAQLRLGYLIGASIPIGVTSIIWTSLTKGNLAVSLVAVTLDTLAAPVLYPLFFKAVAGQALAYDFTGMVLELMGMITIPSLAGMALHDAGGGRFAQFAKTVGGCSAKVAFFLVVFINASLVAPAMEWSLTLLKMLLVSLLLVTAAYAVGFLGSFALRARSRDIVMAMIYNVGLRNIAFGLVVALTYFPPAVAVPVTLFMLYQQPLATIIPYLFARFDRLCRSE